MLTMIWILIELNSIIRLVHKLYKQPSYISMVECEMVLSA